MKTWKNKKTVCRARKSGRFSKRGKCGAYKRQKVKTAKPGWLFF